MAYFILFFRCHLGITSIAHHKHRVVTEAVLAYSLKTYPTLAGAGFADIKIFFSVLAVKLVFRLGLFTLRLLAYAVIGLGALIALSFLYIGFATGLFQIIFGICVAGTFMLLAGLLNW